MHDADTHASALTPTPATPVTPLMPRQRVPSLDLPLVKGGRWRLADRRPANFTMIVFYRGLHCPVCAGYLRDLNGRMSEFEERGVDVVAASTDSADRAASAVERWQLDSLPVAHDLSLPDARRWGLYLSRGRGPTSSGVDEPDVFNEPALYLVRPDGTLYFGAVQTMPFARPHFDDILGALNFVIARDYPARGEVTEIPQREDVGAS